jgi:hypothetical protein
VHASWNQGKTRVEASKFASHQLKPFELALLLTASRSASTMIMISYQTIEKRHKHKHLRCAAEKKKTWKVYRGLFTGIWGHVTLGSSVLLRTCALVTAGFLDNSVFTVSRSFRLPPHMVLVVIVGMSWAASTDGYWG